MFDIGWSEMAVIVLVALVVIGPKDLPRLAREVGRWTGKARAMAREFQRNLDDMAREADLQDIKSQMDKVSRTSLTDTIRDTIDPDRSIQKAVELEGKPFSPPPVSTPAAVTPPAATPPVSTPVVPPPAEAAPDAAKAIDAAVEVPATPAEIPATAPPAIAPRPEAIAEIERALVEPAATPPTPSKPDQAG